MSDVHDVRPGIPDLLTGRTAVVTGAARGIGLALAEMLVGSGATVVLADLDAAELARAAAGLGDSAHAVAGDLTAPGTATELVDATVDLGGGIDIVVNNAGYNRDGRLVTMSDRAWESMLDIHVTAPFRMLRAAGPHLIAAAEADRAAGRRVVRKVVNVTSIAVMGSAFQANYAAGKAAVVGLTKSLAKEWAGHDIAVNAVGFGSVATRLTQDRTPGNTLVGAADEVQLGLPARVMPEVVRSIGFGRPATPQEAAGAAFLLCTPWSDWVTGQLLIAGGGQVFGLSG